MPRKEVRHAVRRGPDSPVRPRCVGRCRWTDGLFGGNPCNRSSTSVNSPSNILLKKGIPGRVRRPWAKSRDGGSLVGANRQFIVELGGSDDRQRIVETSVSSDRHLWRGEVAAVRPFVGTRPTCQRSSAGSTKGRPLCVFCAIPGLAASWPGPPAVPTAGGPMAGQRGLTRTNVRPFRHQSPRCVVGPA
jgi:hypothetical protein